MKSCTLKCDRRILSSATLLGKSPGHCEDIFLVEIPHKAYEFYHMDEADYTVMASETKPRTVEILL